LVLEEMDFVPQSLSDLLHDHLPSLLLPSPLPSSERVFPALIHHLPHQATQGRWRATVEFRRREPLSGEWVVVREGGEAWRWERGAWERSRTRPSLDDLFIQISLASKLAVFVLSKGIRSTSTFDLVILLFMGRYILVTLFTHTRRETC
jgi:hypothetical protein